MERKFPTYDSPQGPVRDFIRYLAEDMTPPQHATLDAAIAHARQIIAGGQDHLCDMGDGKGPRPASEILEELALPDGWRVLWRQIETNMTTSMESQTQALRAMIAAGDDPIYDMGDGEGARPLSAILDELDADDVFAAMVDSQVGGA